MEENEIHTDAPTPPDPDTPVEVHTAANILTGAIRKAFDEGAAAGRATYDANARAANRVMPVVFNVGPLPVTCEATGVMKLRDDWARAAAALGADAPARRGTTELADIESFVAHVQRHKIDGTTALYLDVGDQTVTAVYNGAREGDKGSGWGDDRATVKVEASPEWGAWEEKSGETMGQVELADFLEEHLEDIATPEEGSDHAKAAELLSMARDLQIHTKGKYRRKVDVRTGTGSLVYESEHGEGSTRIPRAFGVALRPWEGGTAFRVEARLRFSLEGGRASFVFTLHRVDEVWIKAWRSLADDLRYRTSDYLPGGDTHGKYVHLPVYLGKAPDVVKVR